MLLYSVMTKPALAATDPIPAPTGPVVLTISGADHPNVGDTLQFDMETLDRSAPWLHGLRPPGRGQQRHLLRTAAETLLTVAGVNGTLLHYLALNDYTADIPVSDADAYRR